MTNTIIQSTVYVSRGIISLGVLVTGVGSESPGIITVFCACLRFLGSVDICFIIQYVLFSHICTYAFRLGGDALTLLQSLRINI